MLVALNNLQEGEGCRCCSCSSWRKM